jgi:hypothetical protein
VSDYDNTNSGAVFKNEKKTKDNQPDRTGSMETKCKSCGVNTEFWVSGWVKKSRAGKMFMSLAFTQKEEQSASSPASGAVSDDFDDDIPF